MSKKPKFTDDDLDLSFDEPEQPPAPKEPEPNYMILLVDRDSGEVIDEINGSRRIFESIKYLSTGDK